MKKTVVITGGSRGIGAACAALFAREGYNTFIGYNKSEKAALKLCDSLRAEGCNVFAIKMDVAQPTEVRAAFLRIAAEFSRVDILINSAGISRWGLFSDTTEEEERELFDVNFGGTSRCIREVVPKMVSAKSGVIINISSIWGSVGASCEALYSATKAAVIGLSKSLAKELGPSGVRVCCISPGVIDTDMCAGLSAEDKKALAEETPLSRLGKAEEVARAALFLASDAASFITGCVLSVDGGITGC